jgi:hypothetical protein
MPIEPWVFKFVVPLSAGSKVSMFENRVLRRIFEPKRDELRGIGENYIMRSLMICIPHPMLFGW